MIVESTRWVKVTDGRLAALAEGSLVRVVVLKRPLAFVRLNGVLRAMDDHCPHQGQPLSGGWVDDGYVVCPFHRMHFDPATGRCRHGLTSNVGIYPVKEDGGDVHVGFAYTTISVFGWKLW
jgi:nitrite reductase/ring-hydroxylating ferredoxin subunit